MKTKTTIKLIFSVVTTIAVSLLLIFVFKIIKNKNMHTNAILATLESKMIEKENISLMSDKISEYENTRELIDSYFVNKKSADYFVEYLENLGKENNTELSVKSIGLKNDKNEEGDLISIKVFIEGSFNNVIKSLIVLENSPYNIFINSLYLNKDLTVITEEDVGTGDIKWSADVTFDVLSF